MNWQSTARSGPNATEIASRWLLRLEEGKLSSAQQSEFEQWVGTNPAHRAALERAATALEITSRHAAAVDLMQMREAALRARGKSRFAAWALAASIAGIGVLITLWMSGHHGFQTLHQIVARSPAVTPAPAMHYATEVGERATISLPDGSTVTLDTQSTLDVAFNETERGVWLRRGQALFEVAKHKSTPFQVYAGGRRITAVGTTFNVRLDGQRLRVALIEGKVQVVVQSPRGFSNLPIEQVMLSPGEILDTAELASMSVKVADVSRTASWREGVSVFVDARLADVVAEMNRYVSVPIVIDKPETGGLRVSGVFKTGDSERFAESVANVFPIAIAHNLQGGIILRSATTEK